MEGSLNVFEKPEAVQWGTVLAAFSTWVWKGWGRGCRSCSWRISGDILGTSGEMY